MTDLTRRTFIGASLATLVAGKMSWSRSSEGELIDIVPFVEEGGSPIGTLIEGSHQGRLVVDLAKIRQESLVTPNDEFFIRTRYPDGLKHEGPWEIALRGHVREETTLRLSDIEGDAESMGSQLLECSGNSKFRKFGLLSSAEWSGVPVATILDRMHPSSRATRLLVTGHDEHSDVRTPRGKGASWIFDFEQLDRAGAFLATGMNGKPLPKDHGEPVRLIMPNWYGCTCIKWVSELELVDDEAASTSQMREFSSRTHQDGVPEMARDFIPATMDQTGMPIRVEKWRSEDGVFYRVWGLLWGGDAPTDRVSIRFREDLPAEPLENLDHHRNDTWTLWSHTWRPTEPGRYDLTLSVDDPGIRTRRLDRDFYLRRVDITEISQTASRTGL